MKNSALITESTLTDRYQTTVPDMVRKALHLNKREKIRYIILADGSVLLTRADHEETDPAIESFLHFLAEDFQQYPEHLQAITPELEARIKGLVKGMDIDLDTPLDDGDK